MNSPRYIDAHKIKLLNSLGGKDENGDLLISLRDVRNAIAQTPTEDVVPARCGEWTSECKDNRVLGWRCSVCNTLTQYHSCIYCPTCGAKNIDWK